MPIAKPTMRITSKTLATAEIILIVALAAVPLFVSFPYRVNIFLSWEGAYRLSLGQLPFRDFGTPLGGAYWLIPGIFFSLFGPQMITLIKAQVFINIMSGLAFRHILYKLDVRASVRFVSVLIFCLSYSFFNFWPWYNHTVIVYEFVALAFLFNYLVPTAMHKRWWHAAIAGLFIALSFLTKQDGGGMSLMIGLALLTYDAWIEKRFTGLLAFISGFALLLAFAISLYGSHHFGYWFNHGQPPHTARISLRDIADEFFSGSQWIKFYLFIIALLLVFKVPAWKTYFSEKKNMLFLLLTLAILAEASVFQVTSYTPPDNNIFYHSFAFAFILNTLLDLLPQTIPVKRVLVLCTAGTLLWWSGVWWKYFQRISDRIFPKQQVEASTNGENVVNRKTYILNTDTADIPMEKWVETDLPVFHKIYMPPPTVDGIKRLMNMDLVKNGHALRVLNMSELTPLAKAMPYELEKNPELPLWFHLGVGMFNKQATMYEDRLRNHYYDLVLFEYVPSLNNFYPFRTRDVLKATYKQVDSFMAPRRGETKGIIEVYVK